MKKYIILSLIIMLILSLAGCSQSAKPSDVRQEVWDEAIRLYKMIDEKAKKAEQLSNSDMEQILMFESRYSKQKNSDTTDREDEIVNMIINLAAIKIRLDEALINGLDVDAGLQRDIYIKYIKTVEEKFNIKP